MKTIVIDLTPEEQFILMHEISALIERLPPVWSTSSANASETIEKTYDALSKLQKALRG